MKAGKAELAAKKRRSLVGSLLSRMEKLSPFAENSTPAGEEKEAAPVAAAAPPASTPEVEVDEEEKFPTPPASPGAAALVKQPSPLPDGYTGILPPLAPELRSRITLVLDMDETLIHSVFSTTNEYRQAEARKEVTHDHDFEVHLEAEDGEEAETACVFIRPGLDKFLETVHGLFEVVVFTAALPVYARPVLDRIDRRGMIHHRLYRDSTVTFKGQPFVKDLTLMGRDMRRLVLIDNNPYAMLATPDNAFPILSFYDDPNDTELLKALHVLSAMAKCDDVRPFLKRKFQFRQQLKQILAP